MVTFGNRTTRPGSTSVAYAASGYIGEVQTFLRHCGVEHMVQWLDDITQDELTEKTLYLRMH